MAIDWSAFKGRTTFIIGADKNCGKTTFLNEALDELRARGVRAAYMSAGVDGEELDYLTGAPKPSVTAVRGDVLATARMAIDESDAVFEVLEVMGKETALGRQCVARAEEGGEVELVGPVGNVELSEVLESLRSRSGADAVLVDGAVDRMTQAGAGRDASYVLVLRATPANLKRVAQRARLALLLNTLEIADCAQNAPPGSGTSGAFQQTSPEPASKNAPQGSDPGGAFASPERVGGAGPLVFRGALTESTLASLPDGPIALEDFTRVFVSLARMEELTASRRVTFRRDFELLGIVVNLEGVGETQFAEALEADAGSDLVEYRLFAKTADRVSDTVSRSRTRATISGAKNAHDRGAEGGIEGAVVAGKEPARGKRSPSGRPKLDLPLDRIERGRELARSIADPVGQLISTHTTTTVERATLRLLGADGVGRNDVPVPNIALDSLQGSLCFGAARYYINAMVAKGLSAAGLNQAIADGLDISDVEPVPSRAVEEKATKLVGDFDRRIAASVNTREGMLERYRANEHSPLLYLIVATGNIYEDVKQATAAADAGADAIAVIRSTAQSLLDYVPFGATTEGFGGTYATQENFRIMREALDEVSRRRERYVRLVNYASGLCMPEIAAMGAFERLDMLLNDSMYGVLFRDINMYRTFVDQHFSRMINSLAGIMINTGEDNYLTTSDAFDKAYTVLASQFINERFALDAGLPPGLIGLGHAFEMDPALEDGFLFEVAQAQMAREIFPDCPLKYMPPTKYVTGDIFKAYAMNTMFNFASKATGQSIHLLGMLTEGIHTPFLQDRHLAVENALYVMNNIASFYDEVEFRRDGIMRRRALEVLDQALDFLEEIEAAGLFDAIEQGRFADIARPRDGGKGADGVIEKADGYWNPVQDHLERKVLGKAKPEVVRLRWEL